MGTQGEVCSNGTRVFVQRGIHDQFVEEFVKQARRMKAGDPLLEDTTIGGTISEEHAKKVLGYVETAVAEGATLNDWIGSIVSLALDPSTRVASEQELSGLIVA